MSNKTHFLPTFGACSNAISAIFFRCYTLSPYTVHSTSQRISTAYMILEYIGPNTGQMLFSSWEKQRKDAFCRQNLFQPRIGSFQFHTDGTISLTNRPLPCSVILGNDGALRTMEKNETYTCTKPFVTGILTLHMNSFLSNPNAAYDAADCRGKMAAGALLRILSHVLAISNLQTIL
jgi:hypothetical protein